MTDDPNQAYGEIKDLLAGPDAQFGFVYDMEIGVAARVMPMLEGNKLLFRYVVWVTKMSATVVRLTVASEIGGPPTPGRVLFSC